jgi:soluble lytic murein transglycosylase
VVNSAPVVKSHDQQIAFVSQIIRKEHPAHPESDKLAKLIVEHSRKAEIDPLFVTAVVRAESMFKHRAISPRGASGLMQLMPETGAYVAKMNKIDLKNSAALHDPETNIRLGISYLKYLELKFSGDRRKVLIAYNWGPANLMRSTTTGSRPPNESIRYVERVLNSHSAWTSLMAQS